MTSHRSLVDASWELTDPNPDIHAMFIQFNREFFWDTLGAVEVKWSKKMTLCAGLCRYTGKFGLCSVVLSEPLLKLRPRKDLVETLLHEMIHAYLFVSDNNREHDAHGPKFVSHMNRINNLTGTHITIYHSFHDEVNHYKTHWWKCDGPCRSRPPFFGLVKRAMNRKPGPHDNWHADHQRTCGGNFIKIKEPADFNNKKKTTTTTTGSTSTKTSPSSSSTGASSSRKIDDYFKRLPGSGSTGASSSFGTSISTAGPSTSSSSSSSTSKGPNTKKPISKPNPVPKPNPIRKPKPIPNNSKENKSGGSGSNSSNGSSNGSAKFPTNRGGGTRMGGSSGSRTITIPAPVITIDDDDDDRSTTNTPSANHNGGNRLTAGNNITNNVNTINHTGNTSTTPGMNTATTTSGGPLYTGFFKKPDDKKPQANTNSSFTPFSGQGFTLGGGGSSSNGPKIPRYK